MMMTEHRHQCHLCKRVFLLQYDQIDYDAWQRGTRIQDALPYLPAGDRELLLSATCDSCFHLLFPWQDDPEDWLNRECECGNPYSDYCPVHGKRRPC